MLQDQAAPMAGLEWHPNVTRYIEVLQLRMLRRQGTADINVQLYVSLKLTYIITD